MIDKNTSRFFIFTSSSFPYEIMFACITINNHGKLALLYYFVSMPWNPIMLVLFGLMSIRVYSFLLQAAKYAIFLISKVNVFNKLNAKLGKLAVVNFLL